MYEGGSTEESGEEREKTKRDGSAKKSQIREERARGQTEGGVCGQSWTGWDRTACDGLNDQELLLVHVKGGRQQRRQTMVVSRGNGCAGSRGTIGWKRGRRERNGDQWQNTKGPAAGAGIRGTRKKKTFNVT
jgi:hypothetical protein